MKSIKKKGVSQTVIELVIITVVIVVIVLAIIVGKLPRSFDDLKQYGNASINLWNKVTGVEEKKAVEEDRAVFTNVYKSFIGAYDNCMKSARTKCFCQIPNIDKLVSQRFYISFEQLLGESFAAKPVVSGEDNIESLIGDPTILSGKFCIALDASDIPPHNRLIINNPSDGRLYFFPGKSNPLAVLGAKDFPSGVHLSYSYYKHYDYSKDLWHGSIETMDLPSDYFFYKLPYPESNEDIVCFYNYLTGIRSTTQDGKSVMYNRVIITAPGSSLKPHVIKQSELCSAVTA